MNNSNKIVRNVGKLFVFISLVILFFHIFIVEEMLKGTGNDIINGIQLFSLINFIYYLIVGIGLIYEKKWAFNLFKIFYYLSYISFPVGTYIAKSLKSKFTRNGVYEYFNTKKIKKKN